jgi:hypothetical protein
LGSHALVKSGSGSAGNTSSGTFEFLAETWRTDAQMSFLLEEGRAHLLPAAPQGFQIPPGRLL